MLSSSIFIEFMYGDILYLFKMKNKPLFYIAPDDLGLDFAYFVLLSHEVLTVWGASSEPESSNEGIGVTKIGRPPGGVGATIWGIAPWLGVLARTPIAGALKLESDWGSCLADFVLYLEVGLDFVVGLPNFGVSPSLKFDDFPELTLRNDDEFCG